MSLSVKTTKQFLKDLGLSEKRKKDIAKIYELMNLIVSESKLSPRYKDHVLKGEYNGCRECHL